MATTPRKSKKTLDLATAQTADGALPTIRSVYELVGIKDVKYREKTYATYQDRLQRMNLLDLQDHAYELAVTPSGNKTTMIDRLERKYLQENPEQREAYQASIAAGRVEPDELSIRERANQIMARVR